MADAVERKREVASSAGRPKRTFSAVHVEHFLWLGLVVGCYALLVAIWQVLVPLLHVKTYVLPVPTAIATALVRGFTSGTYLADMGVTGLEILLGFGIAAVTGTLIAAAIVEVKIVERIVYPLLVALQSLPKVAVAPLILIWAGFGLESKVLVAALVAFFPILVNTMAGLRACDRNMAELFDSLEASRWQKLWYLKIPNAVPYLVAGLSVAYVFALLGAIVGEFIGASAGLGYAIMQLQSQLDTAGVFAILIVLAVMGLVGHSTIEAVGNRVAFWQRTDRADTEHAAQETP